MSNKAGFSFEKDLRGLKAKFTRLPKKYLDATAIAQFNVAVDIMELAKTRVPYETGELANTAYLNNPEYGSREVSVDMGFQGPYAVRQHEDLTYSHPGKGSSNPSGGQQGQPKYLEESVNDFSDDIQREITKALRDFTKDGTMPTLKTSSTNQKGT